MTPTEPDYAVLVPSIEGLHAEGLALLDAIKADPDETESFGAVIADWRQRIRAELGPRHAMEANALDVPERRRPTRADRARYGIPRDEQREMERSMHGLDGILEILRNDGMYFASGEPPRLGAMVTRPRMTTTAEGSSMPPIRILAQEEPR